MTKFVKLCEKTAQYKEFIRYVSKGKYSVDTEGYYRQLAQIHAVRAVRSLTAKSLFGSFQSKMVKALLQNQQHRSDVVDKKKECYKVSALLTWHIEELKSFLITKYPSSYAELRNAQSRDAALRHLFAQAESIVQQLDAFVEYADIILDDIDQAGWALQRITKVLETNQAKGAEL